MAILVTGASGKTGQAVIRALVKHHQVVRAFVHRKEQSEAVIKQGAAEAFVGELNDLNSLKNALQEIQAIYLICPNVHSQELAIARQIVEAAQCAGVRRLVYHSVLHPQVEKMPHHWQKMQVEALLFETQMDCTILQPSAYMQNITAHWQSITRDGIFPVPYSLQARLSLVDLEDVAETAARVLTQDGHVGAVYELAGTPGLSQHQVAALLSEKLERPVRAQQVPLDAWQEQARASGLSGYALDTLLKMFRYYDSFGLCGSPRVLGWLLERAPTSLHDFIVRTIQQYEKSIPSGR